MKIFIVALALVIALAEIASAGWNLYYKDTDAEWVLAGQRYGDKNDCMGQARAFMERTGRKAGCEDEARENAWAEMEHFCAGVEIAGGVRSGAGRLDPMVFARVHARGP